jgi:tetratricopeptide (TPR) repeat protein
VANEALAPAEVIGSPYLSAFAAYAVAHAAIHLGRYDEARVQAEQSMTLARSAGDRQIHGWALMYMGQVSLAWGSHEIAAAQLEGAAAALTEFRKSIWFLPLTFQALALGQLGDSSQARRVLAKALRENMQPRVFYVVVNALPAAAQLVAAQDYFEKALELYALARRYPCVANSRWFEDVVGGDVAGWAAALPPDVADAARERGRARELWETAEELIAEFGEDAP